MKKHPLTLKELLRIICFYADLFLLAISPMVLLLLLVGVFVFLQRWGEHRLLVEAMEQTGLVTEARVQQVDSQDERVEMIFHDARGEERRGLLLVHYTPRPAWENLRPGDIVNIRYLPPFYKEDVLLEGTLEAVRNNRSYLSDIFWVVGACWLLLILRPEILYAGYASEVWKLFAARYGL